MKTLHLIRHSRTIGNDRGLYYGWSDIPLSEEGIAVIKNNLETMRYPDTGGLRIITSGMLRAEQTLELIYGRVEHITEPRFREMNFGSFEMRSHEELKELPEYIEWKKRDFMVSVVPGGECGNDVKRRVIEAMDELYDGDDTLIVCHGGTILILMDCLFPGVYDRMHEWQPAPGFGYTVRFDGRKAVSYERIPK